MKITARDTGNAMHEAGVIDLSRMIDIEALRAYRFTVGKKRVKWLNSFGRRN